MCASFMIRVCSTYNSAAHHSELLSRLLWECYTLLHLHRCKDSLAQTFVVQDEEPPSIGVGIFASGAGTEARCEGDVSVMGSVQGVTVRNGAKLVGQRGDGSRKYASCLLLTDRCNWQWTPQRCSRSLCALTYRLPTIS